MNIELTRARARRNLQWTTLFCTTSFLALANMMSAQAEDAAQTQPANEVTEQVLVTGSLISGTQAVGVPVTEVSMKDFLDSGAITVADTLKTVPSLYIQPTLSPNAQGGDQTREDSVDIHQMNVSGGLRTLMLIDGMRYSLEREIADIYDPSIIPTQALERVDVLADGASATYGSDAVAGVVNLILKRGFDGAVTQLQVGTEDGAVSTQESQLFGRTWDSGDITLTFQHFDTAGINGSALPYYTENFTSYGLDNETSIKSTIPAIVSTGTPSSTIGTSCTNCYSVPKGQNGVGLTWTALLANQGESNEINPYGISQITNSQQSNSVVATFDQRIVQGVRFFAEGFYTNRRTSILYPAVITPYNNLTLETLKVPTNNPYYPIGAPAGLQVSYDFALELPPVSSGSEVSGRYAAGLNLDLPFNWKGKIFGSANQENTYYDQQNSLNANDVNAALGNTIAATAASGATPGIASFTKPANIPYLNLFCDPNAFQCNSPATLAYIAGYAQNPVRYDVTQFGVNFDGPLFALPAGDVKAAIGGSYSTDYFFFESIRTRSPDSPSTGIVVSVPSNSSRQQAAVFGQVNVPIFGDANAIPLFHALELEVSYRYDHYSDFGGTGNPKIAINWEPIEDLKLLGSWGTSFRAPLLENLSPVAARTVTAVNSAAGATGNTQPACPTVGGTAPAGTAAAILNPTCASSLNNPGGIDIAGGSGGLNGITRPANYALQPETGRNLSLGFDFTPHFLPGLDVNATWYNIDISNVITSLALTGVGNALSNPSFQTSILVAGQPGFAAAVAAALAIPQAAVTTAQTSNIQYIIDSASKNLGTLRQEGFDFSANYDWDMGAWGAWNVGITGDYKFHQISTVPGGVPVDSYDTNGEPLAFKLTHRSHIGWSDNGYSATVFMDYTSHVSSTNPLPPASFLTAFPNYSNKIPAEFLFDLSLGYNTMDKPESDYLKNVNLQLVINNILNRQPPFAYDLAASGPVAYLPSLYSPYGRIISFTLTKTW